MPPPTVTARIYTESGGWGLPTIDADGLAAIALLRFADIPFSIHRGASPRMTSANVLPVVVFENSASSEPSVCAGLASLIALFTADLALPDPNEHLTPFMIAESTAFATLVTSRFGPARLYELYMNERNYADIYHSLMEKDARFPLNRLLPMLKRRKVRQKLEGRSEAELYFDAGIALAALSTRLGERGKFFYGDRPSVLDGIVFGYLAPILYIPLPCTELRAQIAKFSNLVAFVARVRQTFFARQGERLIAELDGDSILEARRKEIAQKAAEVDDVTEEEEESEADQERKKWNRYFIWASLAAFATHVLLGTELDISLE